MAKSWAVKARVGPTVYWLLPLVLLVAQVIALSHLYSHLGQGTDPGTTSAAHRQLCGECVSFAPILTAVGASDSAPVLRSADFVRVTAPASRAPARAFRYYPFRSRAPPISI